MLDKTQIINTALKAATLALQAKARLQSSQNRRELVEQFHKKLAQQTEDLVTEAIKPVLKAQVQQIIARLRTKSTELTLKSMMGDAYRTQSKTINRNEFSGLSLGGKVPALPLVRQEEGQCGPAALAAVIYGLTDESPSVQDVAEACAYEPERGTTPKGLAEGASRYGLACSIRQGMTVEQLRGELDAGHAVILDLQAWGNPQEYPELKHGHYVACFGYEYVGDALICMDPSLDGTYGRIDALDLESRWADEGQDGQTNHLGIVCWVM